MSRSKARSSECCGFNGWPLLPGCPRDASTLFPTLPLWVCCCCDCVGTFLAGGLGRGFVVVVVVVVLVVVVVVVGVVGLFVVVVVVVGVAVVVVGGYVVSIGACGVVVMRDLDREKTGYIVVGASSAPRAGVVDTEIRGELNRGVVRLPNSANVLSVSAESSSSRSPLPRLPSTRIVAFGANVV